MDHSELPVPQDLLAEQLAIGGMLESHRTRAAILQQVTAADFWREAHQQIVRAHDLAQLGHDPAGGLAAEEHALQVDGQEAVEVRLGGLQDRRPVHDAGHVGHDVQAAVAVHRDMDQGLDLLPIGHVEGHDIGPPTGPGDVLGGDGGTVLVPVGADHHRSGLGHALGGGPADAAGRSGDDGDPVGEIEGVHVAGP